MLLVKLGLTWDDLLNTGINFQWQRGVVLLTLGSNKYHKLNVRSHMYPLPSCQLSLEIWL